MVTTILPFILIYYGLETLGPTHKVVVKLKLDNLCKVLIAVTSVLKYFGIKCLKMSGLCRVILAFHLWLFRRHVCPSRERVFFL